MPAVRGETTDLAIDDCLGKMRDGGNREQHREEDGGAEIGVKVVVGVAGIDRDMTVFAGGDGHARGRRARGCGRRHGGGRSGRHDGDGGCVGRTRRRSRSMATVKMMCDDQGRLKSMMVKVMFDV